MRAPRRLGLRGSVRAVLAAAAAAAAAEQGRHLVDRLGHGATQHHALAHTETWTWSCLHVPRCALSRLSAPGPSLTRCSLRLADGLPPDAREPAEKPLERFEFKHERER